MMYRGEQYDSDLGLYYLRARFYNPLTGRLMSRDPLDGDPDDPSSLHKYLYADGDPVNASDPTGEATLTENLISNQFVKRLVIGVAVVGVGATAGVGTVGIIGLIRCSLYTDAKTLWAIAQEIGTVQVVLYVFRGCTGYSYGPAPAPSSGPTTGGPSPFPERKPPHDCRTDHPNWPVNYVPFSRIPVTAQHIEDAIAAGCPDALTYLGPNNPQTDSNRRKACPPGTVTTPGMSCDEYPYASTAQGGQLADPAPVPVAEYSRQGGLLSAFYRNLSAGQNFCVVVGP